MKKHVDVPQQEVFDYHTSGPLGSKRANRLADFNKLLETANSSGGMLQDMWRKKGIISRKTSSTIRLVRINQVPNAHENFRPRLYVGIDVTFANPARMSLWRKWRFLDSPSPMSSGEMMVTL